MPKSNAPQTWRKPLSTSLSAAMIPEITHSISWRPINKYETERDFNGWSRNLQSGKNNSMQRAWNGKENSHVVRSLFAHLDFFPDHGASTGRWYVLRRAQAIRAIEKSHGSRVITMIHRQEKRSLFGFAVARHIDLEDAQTIIAAIKVTPDDMPIDLVIHTPGGLVLAAMQIARAVEAHKAKVTVYVPVYAMSGGTLIALAADEIVLGEFSEPQPRIGSGDGSLGNEAALQGGANGTRSGRNVRYGAAGPAMMLWLRSHPG
jgi:Serine dehydrogenase proteinase